MRNKLNETTLWIATYLIVLVILAFIGWNKYKADQFQIRDNKINPNVNYVEFPNDDFASLTKEEIEAYCDWDNWKKTNVMVVIAQVMQIRQSEYRQLTNWMASRKATGGN